MSDEEKLQSLILEVRLLESSLNEVNEREALMARAIVENRAALEALKSLPEIGTSEILVPIGGGLFIKSMAPPPDRLLVSVGADVALEKTEEEAVAFIEERMKELERAISALEAQKAELANKVNATKAKISSVISKQKRG